MNDDKFLIKKLYYSNHGNCEIWIANIDLCEKRQEPTIVVFQNLINPIMKKSVKDLNDCICKTYENKKLLGKLICLNYL